MEDSDCRDFKKNDSVLALYQSNQTKKCIKKISRASTFQDVNEALYKWCGTACSKNICPAGPHFIERVRAKQIAKALGKSDFNGSNGWLIKLKARYITREVRICGESGDAHGETIQSWKEYLKLFVVRMYGISMRQVYLGEYYLKLDLGRKNVGVVRK